jgi:hypothetical protein
MLPMAHGAARAFPGVARNLPLIVHTAHGRSTCVP